MIVRGPVARAAFLLAIGGAFGATGCHRAERAPDGLAEADAGHAGASASVAAGAADASGNASGASDAGDVDEAYLRASPRTGRSIGHTSVVFKVELSGGKKAAFKPASRRGPKRYKGEIAAYRLAVALGLTNVPPAMLRTFRDPEFASALGGAATPSGELYAKEALVTDGAVKGAIIPWIDKLEFLPLESEPWRSRWRAWLTSGATIPDDQKVLARDVSTMLAFDWLTGNWDRWSGGNIGFDSTRGTLLYIDNDGAFFDAPPADALAKSRRLVEGVDRWSTSFVTRLRSLDEAALGRALGEESPGAPLLGDKALAGVVHRRAELLRIVDAKIGDAGADATLAFP